MSSDYLNEYRNRVGQNLTGQIINRTKSFSSGQFTSHPNYKVVLINGVQFDVLYTQGKESDVKTLLFKPETAIDVGSVVEVNGKNYLTMDFLGEGVNEIYPTAKLKLCNSTFPIQSDKTQVLKGYDHRNAPVYEYIETAPRLEPCIVERKLTDDMTNTTLPLPDGKIKVTLKYQATDNIKRNGKFEMYGNQYRITDIDMTKVLNSKGIITLMAEEV